MKLTSIEIAWLAALYEGEGNARMGCTLRFQIGMTDRDVIARAAKIMRAKISGPYMRPSYRDRPHLKPMYLTTCYGGTAAGWMMTLYKFMGKRRRAQFRKLLRLWKRQQVRIFDGSRKATCHPRREYVAKELCRNCYERQRYHKRQERRKHGR